MRPIFFSIIDSRGNPTIRGVYKLNDCYLRIAVPSGASTGVHEALELRDKTSEFSGKGVTKAVNNANFLASKVSWDEPGLESDKILLEIDSTPQKEKMGANAMLAVSMLQFLVAAKKQGKELFQYISDYMGSSPVLPVPFANVINGGKHAGTNLKIQEFMIVPYKATSFYQATRQVTEVYHELKKLIADQFGSSQTAVGDEGGFAPDIKHSRQALDLLMQASANAGHKIAFAIDAAASEFYNQGKYEVEKDKLLTSEELTDYYMSLLSDYPIISLEDPFDQDDFESFKLLLNRINDAGIACQVVGDDLTVSNTTRLTKALGCANSLLLKINQVGLISQALEAAKLAFNNNWTVMVSHRSGETEDTFIADLATGLGCGQIKIGAPCRGERTAKYNRLIELEQLYQLPFAKLSF